MGNNGSSQNKYSLDDVQINSDFNKINLSLGTNNRTKRNNTIA